MKYLISTTTDIQENLSLEEYLFRHCLDDSTIVMLWQNDSAVVLGKHQNPWVEADIAYLEEHNIPLVRRISGGGTVFHDLHNLNFTVIRARTGRQLFDLSEFTAPVCTALQRLGCRAERSPRGDVLIEGMKVCGTAQAENSGRMLFHGCILFDSDLEVLRRALHSEVRPIESRATSSVRSVVTNVSRHLPEKITMDEFRQTVLHAFGEQYGNPTPLVLPDTASQIIREQIDSRYSRWDWNFGHTPRFTIESQHRLALGKLLTITGGRVTAVEGEPDHPFLQRRFEPERML